MEVDVISVVKRALQDDEYALLPSHLAQKIDAYFDKEFGQYLAAKAVYESERQNSDQKISNLENQLQDALNKNESTKANLESANQNLNKLENQIEQYRGEFNKLHESLAKAEHDCAEFKRERDAAVDEKNNVQSRLDRRNIEIERLQADVNQLSEQLQAALASKSDLLAQSEDVENKKITIEYREKRFEQERTLLNNEIKSLSNELYKRVNENTYLRRENTTRMATLQSALDIKIEELQNANATIKSLTDSNNDLTLKIETLVDRLKEQRESEQRYHDSFAQELQSQTRVAELYKGIAEDSKAHIKKLNEAVADLQKMLNEASVQYDNLETKYKQEKESTDLIIANKDECIEILKKEIKDAEELLKMERNQRMEKFVETLSPSASAACKIIKQSTSLTQIANQLREAEDEIQRKNLEIAKLNQYFGTIFHELDETTPMVVRQRDEHEEIVRSNQILLKNNEKLMQELIDLQQNYTEAKEVCAKLEKELSSKQNIQEDLSHQIRVLLKEISDLRAGSSITNHENDANESVYHNSSDIITSKLVTFQNIEQLQSNNQKLLGIVRELTQKTEEAEQLDHNAIVQQRNELESLRSCQQKLMAQVNSQSKTIDALSRQYNTYKALYEQAMKRISGKDNILLDSLDMENGDGEEDKNIPLKEKRSSIIISTTSANESSVLSPKEIEELKKKLEDNEKIMKSLKSDYESYQKEKAKNEKVIFEQLDNLREENYSLTQKNCKLISANENKDEQLKISKSNIDNLKKVIESLEKKVNTSSNVISKHEQTIKHLSDEVSNSQAKLSHYEVLLENAREEIKMLKDIENRLMRERETLQSESQGQRLLLNNLESIKATFERSEAVGKIRLESRLDEAIRECSALRRRLQEEQDRFRELSKHLEEEVSTISNQLNEKNRQISQLEENLKTSQGDLNEKIQQIENLSKKLNISVKNNGNPFDEQIKSLEKELNETRSRSQVMEEQMKLVKNQAVQYCELSERSEKQLLEHIEFYEKFKEATDAEIQKLVSNEKTLTQKIAELENELSKYSNGENASNNDLKNQNLKLLEDLANMDDELKNLKIDFEASKFEINRLNTNLQEAEEKYNNEMVQHSRDLQILASTKEELQKFHQQRHELLQAKQDAVRNLESNKESWERREKLFSEENNQMKQRIEELQKQNEILHSQLELLTNQLAISVAQNTSDNNKSLSEEVSNSLNNSFTEKDANTADQLLQIIRFLRREKENIYTKLEILQSENVRLNSLLTITSKQLEEAKLAEVNVRTKSNTDLVTISKHNDVLRRVETLNAVTDSNRILREERAALVEKLNSANATISKLEEQIAPLQENNCELTMRVDAAQAEIASLKTDVGRWRQRANALIERTNKTTPEDWRRLQNERDNLTKLLTTEKDNVKKLSDLKVKYEQQINNLQRQTQYQNDQLKRNTEEINALKQQNQKLTQDINELREKINRSTENNNKLIADNETKSKEMKQLLSKYVSVRALARKYKEQAEEENRSAEQAASEPIPAETQEQYREEGRKEANERVSTLEKSHNEKIKELETQISSSQKEIARLKKENEELNQMTQMKYERSQSVLRTAKEKIQSLNETNESLVNENNNLRNRLNKQTPSDVNALRVEYEAKIARLEKEKNECLNEKKLERERSTREIENLNSQLNQIQRKFSGQNAASKPSTSSGLTEKTTTTPPTANIKPMAGQSQQQSASVTPRRKEDTPLASIRPMSVPSRSPGVATLFSSTTSAVSSCSTSSPSVAFPTQQVHTTGSNTTEVSSTPSSSQTEYMPATSSASSSNATSLRQVVVPQARQSSAATKTDKSPSVAESTQKMKNNFEIEISIDLGTQPSQQATTQATVGHVLSRTDQQGDNENQQIAEQSTSSSDNNDGAMTENSQLASSSNTVTTTQAGHKRVRESTEGDSSSDNESQGEQDRSPLPQAKRSKVQDVSESGTEPEYQVPTSSQRDQDDDVICIGSEDEDDREDEDDEMEEVEEEHEEDDDDDEDEGDAVNSDVNSDVDEVDEDDSDEPEEMDEEEEGHYEEDEDEEDNDEGYEAMEDGDCEEVEEENQEIDNNEVEIIEISESPTTPQQSANVNLRSGDNAELDFNEEPTEMAQNSAQSQAVSSASGGENVPPASSSTFGYRGRNISSLNRQPQQMVIGHQSSGFEEHGDDGIVPCTPTLFVPRQTDSFGETVNSPHVPSSGRFTFNEPPPSTSSGRTENVEESQAETNESNLEQLDSGTGRSVPTTPHQVSPEIDVPQNVDNEGDNSTIQEQSETPQMIIRDVRTISNSSIVNIPNEDETQSNECSLAGPSNENAQQSISQNDEGSDGVSSEGEKVLLPENQVDEGCEAEASQLPSSNEATQ